VRTLRDRSVPSGNWEANHLQAVVFLRKATPIADIFSAITGDVPETQEDRRKDGVRVQTGPFLGGSLQVVISPIRVDVVLTPAAGPEGKFAAEIFGDFATKLQEFVSAVRKWLPNCGLPALRLSILARAFAAADSDISAYKILGDNLTSVTVRPGEMHDMLFRVNWRAKSAHMPEGYVNRLTTWTAIVAKKLVGTPGSVSMVPIEETHYAYREIDVNTPAEHAEELPADQLVPIFDELFDVVVATAEAGEKEL
jgi:hypothetical protein